MDLFELETDSKKRWRRDVAGMASATDEEIEFTRGAYGDGPRTLAKVVERVIARLEARLADGGERATATALAGKVDKTWREIYSRSLPSAAEVEEQRAKMLARGHAQRKKKLRLGPSNGTLPPPTVSVGKFGAPPASMGLAAPLPKPPKRRFVLKKSAAIAAPTGARAASHRKGATTGSGSNNNNSSSGGGGGGGNGSGSANKGIKKRRRLAHGGSTATANAAAAAVACAEDGAVGRPRATEGGAGEGGGSAAPGRREEDGGGSGSRRGEGEGEGEQAGGGGESRATVDGRIEAGLSSHRGGGGGGGGDDATAPASENEGRPGSGKGGGDVGNGRSRGRGGGGEQRDSDVNGNGSGRGSGSGSGSGGVEGGSKDEDRGGESDAASGEAPDVVVTSNYVGDVARGSSQLRWKLNLEGGVVEGNGGVFVFDKCQCLLRNPV